MGQARQAAEHGGSVLRVVMGDDLAHRLVVRNDARRRWRNAHLDHFAGHADAVTKRDALAHVGWLAIDHHLALGYQRFHVTPRAYASLGQHLVQLWRVRFGGQHPAFGRGIDRSLRRIDVEVTRQHGRKGFRQIQRRGARDFHQGLRRTLIVVVVIIIIVTDLGRSLGQRGILRCHTVFTDPTISATATAATAIAVAATRAVGVAIGGNFALGFGRGLSAGGVGRFAQIAARCGLDRHRGRRRLGRVCWHWMRG